jgi:hypothetical protein
MIMEPYAGDRPAAAGAGRGPRAAGEPRSRLHGSNGPPPPHRPGSPTLRVPSAGDAAGSSGPVARPGAGGAGVTASAGRGGGSPGAGHVDVG